MQYEGKRLSFRSTFNVFVPSVLTGKQCSFPTKSLEEVTRKLLN